MKYYSTIELHSNISQKEMFEKSFQRPTNFFKLSGRQQWDIDANLGILDWEGGNLSDEEMKRFQDHYKSKRISNVVKQSEIKTFPKIVDSPNYDEIDRGNIGSFVDLMVKLKKSSYEYHYYKGKLGYITMENPEGVITRYQIEQKLYDIVSGILGR